MSKNKRLKPAERICNNCSITISNLLERELQLLPICRPFFGGHAVDVGVRDWIDSSGISKRKPKRSGRADTWSQIAGHIFHVLS